MFDYPDAKPLDIRQREILVRMMYLAFLEIRTLGWEGKAQQAADLADAFHNLPMLFESGRFSLEQFRRSLEVYQTKYPERRVCDYLKELKEVTTAGA